MNIVKAERKAILTAMKAGSFQAMEVHLLNAPVSEDDTTVLADCTAAEATFDGYAEKTAQAFGTIVENDAGHFEMMMGNQLFVCTGDAVSENIYGFYITTAATADLLGVHLFDEPIPIAAADQALGFVPKIELDSITGSAVLTA